jgi:hypothetical protein
MRKFFGKIMAGVFAATLTFTPVAAANQDEITYGVPTKELIQLITEAKPSADTKNTTPSTDRFIIRDDPGGNVSEFVQSLMYAKNKGYKFKIDGYCASACTLILAKPLKLDICVTPKASFMFHQPFAVGPDRKPYHSIPYIIGTQQMWENLFYANYPDWVKKLIDANGGVPNVYKGAKMSDMYEVNYKTMGVNIPTCVDEVAAK